MSWLLELHGNGRHGDDTHAARPPPESVFSATMTLLCLCCQDPCTNGTLECFSTTH